MNITEVRVKLVSDNTERLKAFCSITLDGAYVIRDLKVIEGVTGPFVAMPSRKLADRCPKCGNKNHLRARYCNDCGARLKEDRAPRDSQGRVKLHADVAHPINTTCREQIQQAVIEAYQKEIDASGQPDYQPQAYDDEELGVSEYDDFISELKDSAARRAAARSDRAEKAPPPEPAERVEKERSRSAKKPAEELLKGRPRPVVPAREPQRSAEPAADGFASGIM